MADPATLVTPRLLLRQWQEADREGCAALVGDPLVRTYFASVLDRAQSDAMVDRFHAHIAQHGFGFWAVEERATGAFAGFLGLLTLAPDYPFAPGVEIGWQLRPSFWGRGLAREAAQASLDFGFAELGLAEIVAFAVEANWRSLRVMEAIGMVRDRAGDFDHPRLPMGHNLRRHILYKRSAK